MKYLLVEVIERDISIPEYFNTYEEAYAKMCEYFSEARGVAIDEIRGELDEDICITENTAWTERYGQNFDWKIFQVNDDGAIDELSLCQK